jgi:molybdenum storage protein
VVIGNRLHEYNFRTDVLGDLFDLEFPEMGCLNLDLTAGDSNDAVLGGLDTLADFLAFTHIDFHGLYLHATPSPAAHIPALGDIAALVYQLIYADLYLLMAIVSLVDSMVKRFELKSGLQGETLVRKGMMKGRRNPSPQIRIAPDINIIKIGGHGVIDYGREVMYPLCEEIGALSKKHQLLIATGGGGRVRHIMDIGIDLGMPTGVLAELAGKISEQNAIMVSILLSNYGGTRIHTGDLLELPMLLKLGILPVTHGTPPYGLYEHPARSEMIPPHRTDTGAFLIAEVLGAKNCIIGKNVDGLYTEDPMKNPDAELIRDITAEELIRMNLEDMVLEPMVVELLKDAVHIREVRIINCHKRGNIEKAINGQNVGTIIRAE